MFDVACSMLHTARYGFIAEFLVHAIVATQPPFGHRNSENLLSSWCFTFLVFRTGKRNLTLSSASRVPRTRPARRDVRGVFVVGIFHEKQFPVAEPARDHWLERCVVHRQPPHKESTLHSTDVPWRLRAWLTPPTSTPSAQYSRMQVFWQSTVDGLPIATVRAMLLGCYLLRCFLAVCQRVSYGDRLPTASAGAQRSLAPCWRLLSVTWPLD